MKLYGHIILSLFLILAGGCVSQFIPEVSESQVLLVVEGLITDQPGVNTIKISKSVPLDQRYTFRPLTNCAVTITDDAGNIYVLTEASDGTYKTDSAQFRGVVGRRYQLGIKVNDVAFSFGSYESIPMEMKAVPPIDSVWYEKVPLRFFSNGVPQEEGCQIYLDTHDPEGKCKFYRWTFTETWQISIPYPTPKNICWTSENSDLIKIKTTNSLVEDRINSYPLLFISNNTDRLQTKYSILTQQYSLNEDEFDYWSRLRSISEENGGLYDVTPASINGNIFNVDDPYEQVLGFFSVSAVASNRLFIPGNFAGQKNLYNDCVTDTSYVMNPDSIPGINENIWLLMRFDYGMPPYLVLSRYQRCADCTTRGTLVEPSFWRDDED